MWSHVTRKIRPALSGPDDKRLRIAVAAFAVLLGLNLLLSAAFIAPETRRIADYDARYRELRKRHADATLFEKEKPAFAGITAGIPAQKDMPLLVKDLVQTAHRLNLSVSSVKYDIPKRAQGELELLAFSFPAEGRYPELKRFIYEVETSDRLVGIQGLKMTSVKGKVSIDMKLVTYIKGQ